MRNRKLDQYIKDVAEGRVSPAEMAERLRMSAYDDMDFAKLDTNRELRTGRGEVVFGLGKTPEQVAAIMRRMAEHAVDGAGGDGDIGGAGGAGKAAKDGGVGEAGRDVRAGMVAESGGAERVPPVIATKASIEQFAAVEGAFADGFLGAHGLALEYNETARMIIVRDKAPEASQRPIAGQQQARSGEGEAPLGGSGAAMLGGEGEARRQGGLIAVVSGGTADMPVAEEAAVTAELYGHEVMRVYDVGISGLHRLLDRVDDIRKADVVIAVAGMEGALASVLSGLVYRPVVAVPTSIGYGITLSGLTPLFAMLGSCSLGIGVMNIDNGFGAAHYASMIVGAGRA